MKFKIECHIDGFGFGAHYFDNTYGHGFMLVVGPVQFILERAR